MFGNNGQITQDFTVTSSGGVYAVEILYFRAGDETTAPISAGQMDKVRALQLDITSLPATCDVEVDILRPGTDPAVSANWTNHLVYSTVGIKVIEMLLDRMVRVRAKSGGTSGTATVAATWSGSN